MNKQLVSILMGSDSDLTIMNEAGKALDALGVGYEITVASAHRSPDLVVEHVKNALQQGVKVFIAGAGGAAHLAGVVAALTSLPVIGVPIQAKSLDGLDSLLSMVQMPQGVPVATVGIDSAFNAGILATQILAVSNSELTARLGDYKKSLAEGVVQKATKLKELGVEQYLQAKK